LQQPIETTEPCGERENLQQPQEKQEEGGRMGQRQDLNYYSFIAYLIIKAGGSSTNKYGNGREH
jgi:hypothetical protein